MGSCLAFCYYVKQLFDLTLSEQTREDACMCGMRYDLFGLDFSSFSLLLLRCLGVFFLCSRLVGTIGSWGFANLLKPRRLFARFSLSEL